MTERHWLAFGVLGAGTIGLLSLWLVAKGRNREALALGVATTLTSTIFAAARVLAPEEPAKVYVVDPSSLDVGPISVGPIAGISARRA